MPILVVVMVMLDRPTGGMVATLLCAPTALLAGWLLFPYFQELPRKSQSRIVLAPVLGYIGLIVLFTACSLLLGAADRGQAMGNFGYQNLRNAWRSWIGRLSRPRVMVY
ncbi:hypothetical protein ACWGLE_15945 [Streptomyces sp. NPDC055897]